MNSDVRRQCDQLIDLLSHFDDSSSDLRTKVCALVPAWDLLRDIGSGVIPHEIATSARDRILYYFQHYPETIISNREIMVISGISEWARRVRELRREMGWNICNGLAIKEMIESGDILPADQLKSLEKMTKDDYIMLTTEQDREAAHRWKQANDIRKRSCGAKEKILSFLKENIGKAVTGEELRYVTNDRSEWARRTRELRTEEGWQICTHWNGRPDLPLGTYILESLEQLPAHDRKIDDKTRCEVLIRDQHTCQICGWSHEQWVKSDPRHLELHHKKHHIDGGDNTAKNLQTLCSICHDNEHRSN